jgi:hypothetical protein
MHLKARMPGLNGDELCLRPAVAGNDHFIAARGSLEQVRELILGGPYVDDEGWFLEGGGFTQDRFVGFGGWVSERLPIHASNVAS